MLSDHDMMFKTPPGDEFSSTITHMKISREFMKFFFLEILAFFQILLIFTYIFLTKLCTKKWLKQRLNRSIFEWIGSSKDDKFWADYRKYFSESYLWRTDSFEDTSVQSFFKSFFVHNLVRKIYVKRSKNWKNDKISGKKISWILEIFSCE